MVLTVWARVVSLALISHDCNLAFNIEYAVGKNLEFIRLSYLEVISKKGLGKCVKRAKLKKKNLPKLYLPEF